MRPRHCKICRQLFEKRSMAHVVCSPACAVVLAQRAREKKAKADYKARKEAIKTIPGLKAEVQKLANRYARLRDELAGLPCICCGRWPKASFLTGGEWDAGHYRSVGSADHLRFDERNIHRQLKQCNRDGAGRAVDYRIGLIKRYGIEFVEALEGDQTIVKWTRERLLELKAHYKQKIKELQAKPLREAA